MSRNQTLQLFGFKGSELTRRVLAGLREPLAENCRCVTWIVTQLREKMAIEHDRSLLMMF